MSENKLLMKDNENLKTTIQLTQTRNFTKQDKSLLNQQAYLLEWLKGTRPSLLDDFSNDDISKCLDLSILTKCIERLVQALEIAEREGRNNNNDLDQPEDISTYLNPRPLQTSNSVNPSGYNYFSKKIQSNSQLMTDKSNDK